MGANTLSSLSAPSLLAMAVRNMRFSDNRSDLAATASGITRPERWAELLGLTDDAHITLAFAALHTEAMPPDVPPENRNCAQQETLSVTLKSCGRTLLLQARCVRQWRRISGSQRTHSRIILGLRMPPYGTQYDIDLYCPPESTQAALRAAESLGYEAVHSQSLDSDHLPVMIRRTGWRWRGDYYDPDQPLALEIHHRFWTPGLGFSVQGQDRFWRQRTTGRFHDIELPALHPVHRLVYAAWHAVRQPAAR